MLFRYAAFLALGAAVAGGPVTAGGPVAAAAPTARVTATLTAALADLDGSGVFSVAFGPGRSTWPSATARAAYCSGTPGPGGSPRPQRSARHSGEFAGVRAGRYHPGRGDADSNVYLWNIATRKITATFTQPTLEVYSVAFGPGKATLAAGDLDGRTYLWDVATRKLITVLTDPVFHRKPPSRDIPASPDVASVAFGPGGILAAGDGKGGLLRELHALRPGNLRRGSGGVRAGRHFFFCVCVAFGPGGVLAVAEGNGLDYLWDTATGKLVATLADPGRTGTWGWRSARTGSPWPPATTAALPTCGGSAGALPDPAAPVSADELPEGWCCWSGAAAVEPPEAVAGQGQGESQEHPGFGPLEGPVVAGGLVALGDPDPVAGHAVVQRG